MTSDAQSINGSVLASVGASITATGYNSLIMLDVAAKQANSIDSDKLKAALENLTMPPAPRPWLWYGPNDEVGSFAYSTSTHFPKAQPDAFKYVSPGSYNSDGLYVPGS